MMTFCTFYKWKMNSLILMQIYWAAIKEWEIFMS